MKLKPLIARQRKLRREAADHTEKLLRVVGAELDDCGIPYRLEKSRIVIPKGEYCDPLVIGVRQDLYTFGIGSIPPVPHGRSLDDLLTILARYLA